MYSKRSAFLHSKGSELFVNAKSQRKKMQFPWKLEPSSSELFVCIYGSLLLHLQDEGAPTEGLHEVKLPSSLGEAI